MSKSLLELACDAERSTRASRLESAKAEAEKALGVMAGLLETAIMKDIRSGSRYCCVRRVKEDSPEVRWLRSEGLTVSCYVGHDSANDYDYYNITVTGWATDSGVPVEAPEGEGLLQRCCNAYRVLWHKGLAFVLADFDRIQGKILEAARNGEPCKRFKDQRMAKGSGMSTGDLALIHVLRGQGLTVTVEDDTLSIVVSGW